MKRKRTAGSDPEGINFAGEVMKHPCGVQPEGNLLLAGAEAAEATTRSRREGLGAFNALNDTMLLELLLRLSTNELLALSACSRVLWVYAFHDELWRPRALRGLADGDFIFRGTWRSSLLASRALDKGIQATEVEAAYNGSPAIVSSGLFSDVLYQPWVVAAAAIPRIWTAVNAIDVERREQLTPSEFASDFDNPNIPLILTDCTKDWAATSAWTPENLVSQYSSTLFEVFDEYAVSCILRCLSFLSLVHVIMHAFYLTLCQCTCVPFFPWIYLSDDL